MNIAWLIVMAIAVVAAVYTLAERLLFGIWQIGSLRHGNAKQRILAISIDAPTESAEAHRLLDILRAEQVATTFFVDAEMALRQPQLVQCMVADGHIVAARSPWSNRPAWRAPFTAQRRVAQAQSAVAAAAGQTVAYYRPLRTELCVAIHIACKRLRLRPVLWSVEVPTHVPSSQVDACIRRVIAAATPGTILRCVSNSAANGPRTTAPGDNSLVAIVPTIISRLRQLGFAFVTVPALDAAQQQARRAQPAVYDGYPRWRRCLIACWQPVELLFATIYNIVALNSILRISKTVWQHGPRCTSPDGPAVICDGVPALDLHFQNDTLIAISATGDNRSLIRGLRLTRDGFADLAKILRHHPDFQDIKVVMALTLMNRGIDLLGFHVEELPDSGEKRRLQAYMRFLMGMYHPDGFRRLQQGKQAMSLKLVWMTRDEVIHKYGNAAT